MADIQPPEQRIRKRRRRTIACSQCRSRKLKCDREYPTCGRCLKSKAPAKCSYEDGFLWQQPSTVDSSFAERSGASAPASTQSQMQLVDRPVAHPTPDSGISSSRPQLTNLTNTNPTPGEKRDRFLETVLGAPKAAVNQDFMNTELLHRHRHHPSNQDSRADSVQDDEPPVSPSQQLDLSPRIMIRGKDTKTRYNGSGIFANLIAQFPDLRSFAEEIRLASPHLSALRFDLTRVTRGLWKKKILNEAVQNLDTPSLIALLPSRDTVDELVVLYLTHVESTHRILHIPTFLKELEAFWDQKHNPAVVSPAFVVQLLLVLACAWNLADFATLELKNGSSLDCYTAINWVKHADKWIETAHIKRSDIVILRLHILLVTAQKSLGMGRSKAWLTTATLVKQAMLAGYHRDTSLYTKISPFNQEMRRRIWITILELDLQVSFERGMPPSVQESDYDTATPLNVNDIDLHEAVEELPTERSLEDFTDCSFQTILTQSLPLRLKVCHLMHSPRIRCRYEDILRLDWELNRHMSRIPNWKMPELGHIKTADKIALTKAMLENKIGLSLLSIHTPFAIEAPREPLFAPSSRARLEIVTMILSTQKRLQETSRSLSLCNLGDWTVQAYCSICQLLHEGAANPGLSLIHTLPGLPESLISLVEVALACMESRLLLVIKGAKEYFFMSTILALVKAKMWAVQATIYKQEVVERVILFAQTLFTRHANCAHLGELGMGSFKTNQVPNLNVPQQFVPEINLPMPEDFGLTASTDLDPYLGAFDWGDMAGFAFE
ncbi:putative C6 transcription factor [Aspergillus mulundensis]|uniref:Putative Zn(II)2Cys6 transcription facto n=1 Tax=Aspergillus mulundensis TaxID=1810919 RepID=A0A3D8SKS3_9EURO|nr:putative Zn(II)2Cys6 transcription facto [Aspergillus mulundensis]RDW86771.1 putative Zn(II)2Cys6 transcription facto [Aspergillus mulundensis]